MKSSVLSLVFLGVVAIPFSIVQAHEIRPAFLEIRETSSGQFEVHWKVPARGRRERLNLQLRFGSDVEITSEPISAFVADSHLQRFQIRHPRGLHGSTIIIDGLPGTYTDVLARLEFQDGLELTHRITPEKPSYLVQSDRVLVQLAQTYLLLGIEHILFGIDHLLFVFAMLLLIDNRRRLIETVTAFTVAHSITLALAALELIVVPGPPVEAIIALSIVFVAAEVIRAHRGERGFTARFPWGISFSFGLLHGFGFAGALNEIGLPQRSIPLTLLTFNLGVEIGQLLFVGVVLLFGSVFKRLRWRSPSWLQLTPAYAIGIIATFWVLERSSSYLIK